MGQLFIVLAVALVAAALVFGVTVLIMGGDQGLEPAEPDGRAVPLPSTRQLTESDIGKIRFDVTLRGYRMAQVDQALRRASYDLGYKEELIGVLEAEVEALRAGRVEEADSLRVAREAAARPASVPGDASLGPDGEPIGGRTIELGEAGPAGPDGAGTPGASASDAGTADAGTADAEVADGEAPGGGAEGDQAAHGSGTEAGAADRAAVPDEADDEVAGDGAEAAERGWSVGLGTMSDPAAAEPAK